MATLQQEEVSLQREYESVHSVLDRYEELQKQNQRLVESIEKEKETLAALREERRRTLDNLLTSEE